MPFPRRMCSRVRSNNRMEDYMQSPMESPVTRRNSSGKAGIVWVVIIVVLASLGAYWLAHRDGSGNPQGAVQGEVFTSPVETVVGFYAWYLSAYGNPLAEGAYRVRNELSGVLVAKVDALVRQSSVFDPIVCANSRPASVDVVLVSSQADTAVMQVTPSDQDVSAFNVSLERQGDTWRMTDIVCLQGK